MLNENVSLEELHNAFKEALCAYLLKLNVNFCHDFHKYSVLFKLDVKDTLNKDGDLIITNYEFNFVDEQIVKVEDGL